MGNRRYRFVGSIITAFCLLFSPFGQTQSLSHDVTSFRIGTGGAGGTYYPVGRTIAQAISEQSLATACEGRSCPPRLLAVAQTSNGSVANLNALIGATLEGAFIQANIVHWGHSGTGLFDGDPPQRDLRAIATLYSEAVHLVVSRDSGIESVMDLAGHRVSLDEPGSGTLVDAHQVLAAIGLRVEDIRAEYMKADLALERMNAGHLDAFFAVAGAPMAALLESEALATGDIRVIPVDGPAIEDMLGKNGFYTRLTIPSETYPSHSDIATIGVGAQFVTHARIPESVVYALTRLLWSEETRARLDESHRMARDIRIEGALDGLTIPLHPGAERFYREIGLND